MFRLGDELAFDIRHPGLRNFGGLTAISWIDAGICGSPDELLETRHPNDVDIVTFCHRPSHLVGDDMGWKAFFDATYLFWSPHK